MLVLVCVSLSVPARDILLLLLRDCLFRVSCYSRAVP